MLPTKGEAYELFWRAKVPLKMIMDQLQMSKSTLLRLLCYAKENPDSLSSPGKRELAWRTPRSWTSPSGTWRCACRCHQQGGKPYQVLASRAVHPMGPFQGQNRINKEIIKLIYMCGVNLSVVHCTVFFHICPAAPTVHIQTRSTVQKVGGGQGLGWVWLVNNHAQ